MKNKNLKSGLLVICAVSLAISCGCSKVQQDLAAETPPSTTVVPDVDIALFAVDHPEQFPFATATEHPSVSELVVTGTVNPDISRSVPVVSLTSGRVIAIHARLGDTVQKGQLLLTVRSDDVASGFNDYKAAVAAHKAAVADAVLARTQMERAQNLYGHGAISMSDLQIAQNAENKAKLAEDQTQADVETKADHLRLLGNDPDRPNNVVDILAPVSGVITDQQVTNSAGVQALGGSNPFTISDLSSVWIICDAYENDLANVRMGDTADIRLNAYPGQVFKGKISNIGSVLDPNLRTAKVRIEVQNPGSMRLGMFVTAIFHGQSMQMHTAVPASSVLHMHDRDWVYVPAPDKKFRRVEVVTGNNLPGNLQEVLSGINPGQEVVSNALVLEHTIDQ